MQPSLDRIERAVVALGSAQLGRGASANLIRWLAVKWAGVGHDTAVVVDRAVTVEFANLYFAVPGMDPYRWFDPFTGNWSKIQANGGWPVGSVLTQIKRPPPSLKGVLVSEEHPPAAMVALPPSDEYLVALHTLLPPGRRVPLADLAIWRYRFGIPESLEEDSPTEEALADALAAEFNLSTPERSILFTEDDEPADAGDTTWYTGQWDPMELAALLPTPRRAGPEEVRAPEPPTDNPQDEQGGYEHLSEYAALPLETADVEALIGRVETAVHKRELLLPDTELIEQCVLGLLTGHIVLQGPPGTGKTTLARALAEAFDASSELQTATADWSTYDVIGGLQPSVGEDEREVLRPWLGHVPRAALRCARVARDHQDHPDDHPEQAHWLIIDEFSRAQVDKAIGGLYTMLASCSWEAAASTPSSCGSRTTPPARSYPSRAGSASSRR